MNRIFDYVRFFWFWTTIPVITVFAFIWVFIRYGFLRMMGSNNTSLAIHHCASVWGRSILYLNPGWTFEVSGQENLPRPGQGAVIVSNHASGLDICAIYATKIQFRWLSKAAVFKIPLVGQAMKWSGYVPVIRGSRESHMAAMKASSGWIQRGIPMLFFPEGTRSKDGEIQEFKTGAFRLAIAEGVAVFPLVISGSSDGARAHTLVPKKAHMVISALPAMSPRPEEHINQFMARCRQVMVAELGRLKSQQRRD